MTKFLFAVILAFAFSLPLNKLHKEELVELAEKAETGETCEDTPSWSNGYGHDCLSYGTTMEWCANGNALPDKEWALGSTYNYPENNCCVCGKGTVEYGRWILNISCNGFDICPWVSVRRRIIPGASTAQFRIQPIPDPTGCLVRHNVPNINQLQISDDGGQTWRFAGGSSLICANIGMTFDGEPVFEETEAPTEAPTEPPTEAPTQPPTEAPTEPPTEAPTQPPTEAPAEEEEGGKEEGDSQCERTDGRCGPLFDDAKCSGTPAYAIYCNADNGWCGNTDAHRNAQLGSEYDLSSCGTDEGLSCKPEDDCPSETVCKPSVMPEAIGAEVVWTCQEAGPLAVGDVCKLGGAETGILDRSDECPTGAVCAEKLDTLAIGGELPWTCQEAALVEKAEETGDHPQPKLKLPVDQRPNQVMWYPPRAPCNRDTHLEKGNYPIVGYVHYGGHQVFIQKYNGYNRVFEKRSYRIAGTPQGAVELGFYDGDYIYTKYDSRIQFFGTPEGAEKKGTVSGCNNDDEKGAAAAVTLIKMQQEIEKRHQMG